MSLNNIRVQTRLWVVMLGVITMLLAFGAATIWTLERQADQALQAVSEAADGIAIVTEWKTATANNMPMTRGALSSADPATASLLDGAIKANIGVISGLQKKLGERLTTDTDKRLMQDVADVRTKVLDMLGKVSAVRKSGNLAGTTAMLDTQFMPIANQYLKAQQAVVDEQLAKRDRAIADAQAARERLHVLTASVLGAVLLCALWAVHHLIGAITQPLRHAVSIAQRISQGDLTTDVQSERRDEFGELLRALDGMNRHLHQVVAEVRKGVESVFTASGEIAQGNLDLSNRTEQTASSLQETAARMAELTQALGMAAETAQQADSLARTAADAAGRGGDVVGHAVRSMEQISNSSRRIADIIGMIDGIAFQTNILALNAAVEAARAGEQGRGFAVVASEVRGLAQRSAQAAREIKDLINTSVASIGTGSDQVNRAGESMHEIVASVERVTALMREITQSTVEQRQGVGDVHGSINRLDTMTQQNAALVEQSAAAADSMRSQAERLSSVVSVFRLDASARPAAPAH